MVEMNVRILMPLVAGKARRDQTLFQLRDLGYVNGLAIEMRSPSLLRREEFIARRIVNNACDPSRLPGVPLLKTHRHREHWISVGEIRSAIERVDVPPVLSAPIVQPLLFSQDIV
jgi:hypothetical protein